MLLCGGLLPLPVVWRTLRSRGHSRSGQAHYRSRLKAIGLPGEGPSLPKNFRFGENFRQQVCIHVCMYVRMHVRNAEGPLACRSILYHSTFCVPCFFRSGSHLSTTEIVAPNPLPPALPPPPRRFAENTHNTTPTYLHSVRKPYFILIILLLFIFICSFIYCYYWCSSI